MRTLAITFFLCVLSSSLAFAEQKTLKWGGDNAGAAPFIFLDPSDPTRLTGFEVEVAELLAEELGMKPEFVQNQWDSLIPGLQRNNFDVVINAVEITEDRKKEVDFSIPYFLTFEQLTVRKDNQDIVGLESLAGRKAGTIKASLAERLLREHASIETVTYDDQTALYEDLALGRVDAVLLDQPAALFYGSVDARLKTLDRPFGSMTYGMCVRKGEPEFLAKVNAAIHRLIANGKLRLAYERWGVWNAQMGRAFADEAVHLVPPTELQRCLRALQSKGWKEAVHQYLGYVPILARGALITVELSLIGMLFAVLLGLSIALTRLYAPFPFSHLAVIYVEFVRGTPLLIQLFFIYYGLPSLGIKLNPFVAAIMGLAINYGAYEAEVYRAGILAIPASQMDAALSLGFTRWQALWHIIIPQGLRVVLPPMTNDFISLLKDSSLVSVITLVELTRAYGQLASTYYDYLGIGLLTAIMYFLMGIPFVRLSRWAEARFSVAHKAP